MTKQTVSFMIRYIIIPPSDRSLNHPIAAICREAAPAPKLSEDFSGIGHSDLQSSHCIRKGSAGNSRFCQPGLGVITVVSSDASHPDVRAVKRSNKKLLLKSEKAA
jgi:hypothetical protein